MCQSAIRAIALGSVALLASAGCSDQYADVGTIDVSASKAKSAESGGGPAGKQVRARPRQASASSR